MKKFLEALIARHQNTVNSLRSRIEASTDAAEVRSLTSELAEANTALEEARSQLNTWNEEHPEGGDPAGDPAPAAATNQRGAFNPLASRSVGGSVTGAEDSDDPYGTLEYRRAFMNFVMRNQPIPAELRADANSVTGENGAVIPTTVLNMILTDHEQYGHILPLVNHTNYAFGTQIPKAQLGQIVATWATEGNGSDKQKYAVSGSVSFTAFKLRCEVSVSYEMTTFALDAFEKKIAEAIARAMTVAKEAAIFNGTGEGQPSGLALSEAPEGQEIEVSELNYQALVEAEAAVPSYYENRAVYLMSKKTYMGFIGMVDSVGQPIARTTIGIHGKPERTLMGRQVIYTEDYLPSFAAAEVGDTFGYIFDLKDYTLNTSAQIGIASRTNWDNENKETKCVQWCDGKPVTVQSMVRLVKAAPAEAEG